MRDPWRIVYFTLMLIWCGQAWAAANSLGQTLGAITVADWVSLTMLSFVSGLFALLHRVRKSFEAMALAAAGKDHSIDDLAYGPWWLFALCHMTGALFVGFLVFSFCEAVDVNSYLEAAYIAATSWGGAKFADKLADGLADRFLNRSKS